MLSGSYLANSPQARTYPISLEDPNFRTELVKFANNGSVSAGGFTHLSSRYEFFKDLEIDVKTRDFVSNQSYNSNLKLNTDKLDYLLKSLSLDGLEDKFLTSLSNGQYRRARIAKVLYRDPSLLLIDDPFLGLDPVATETVSQVLNQIAGSESSPTTIAMGLRVQDNVPEWVEKVVIVDKSGITHQGTRADLKSELQHLQDLFYEHHNALQKSTHSKVQAYLPPKHRKHSGKPMIEMKGVNIKYRGVPVLKDLEWSVKEGEKWHIRGRNGTGKTTLLSLVTLDHPQSWSRKIIVNGTSRKAGNTNYFDANKIIGFTSPELHAIFPKNLSVNQTISTGYVVGSYIPPKKLTPEQQTKIEKYLDIVDLRSHENDRFGDLTVSNQKLVLLLRALINDPEILILDESLSAMTDEDVIKGKCLVDNWDKGCCLIIGHVDEEVPKCDKYITMNNARTGEYEIGDVKPTKS